MFSEDNYWFRREDGICRRPILSSWFFIQSLSNEFSRTTFVGSDDWDQTHGKISNGLNFLVNYVFGCLRVVKLKINWLG